MQPKIRAGMPLEAFIQEFNERPFEIIDGEKVYVMPTVFGPSHFIRLLFLLLYNYVHTNKLGEVYQEITFILPDTYHSRWVEGSRIPDVMFYSGTRIPDYQQQNPDWYGQPLALVPDLVIAVVSPTDHYTDVDKKAAAYLADGVRLVWVFNPQIGRMAVHRTGSNQQTNLTIADTLDGEDVLPGFSIALQNVFASPQSHE